MKVWPLWAQQTDCKICTVKADKKLALYRILGHEWM